MPGSQSCLRWRLLPSEGCSQRRRAPPTCRPCRRSASRPVPPLWAERHRHGDGLGSGPVAGRHHPALRRREPDRHARASARPRLHQHPPRRCLPRADEPQFRLDDPHVLCRYARPDHRVRPRRRPAQPARPIRAGRRAGGVGDCGAQLGRPVGARPERDVHRDVGKHRRIAVRHRPVQGGRRATTARRRRSTAAGNASIDALGPRRRQPIPSARSSRATTPTSRARPDSCSAGSSL